MSTMIMYYDNMYSVQFMSWSICTHGYKYWTAWQHFHQLAWQQTICNSSKHFSLDWNLLSNWKALFVSL